MTKNLHMLSEQSEGKRFKTKLWFINFLKESKVKQPLCSTTHLIYQRAELEQTAGHLQQRAWYGPGDGETFSVSAAAQALAVGPALQFQTRQPARPPLSTWSHWQCAAVSDSHHSTFLLLSYTEGILNTGKYPWLVVCFYGIKDSGQTNDITIQNFNVFGSEWTARH